MSTHINWDLISELYNIKREDINHLHEMMTEMSLLSSGWIQDRAVTRAEYKKAWALSVCCETLKDEDAASKIQCGYKVIDKHFTQ